MERKYFAPIEGRTYKNRGGGTYVCVRSCDGTGSAVMMNTATGWTLLAHGCGTYGGDVMDWDYSTGGHFVKVEEEG